MTRRIVSSLVTAGCLLAVPPLGAHHSHPYFYDQCRALTIEGRVDRVQWIDPHTLITLTRGDGAVYIVDWNPVSRLKSSGLIGPAQAALVTGTRIAVTGNPIRTLAQIRAFFPDYPRDEVNPNVVDPTHIRRVDDGWRWERTPVDRMPGSLTPPCEAPRK